MSLAMGAAGNAQMDRWPTTSSPQNYYTATRRSSLANSVSTPSSPDSMISDTSRTSRSSSISSASSLTSAPHTKLDVLARCRSAKLCNERYASRPTIASVPEDYEENMTSSPESYNGPVSNDLGGMSFETLASKRESEVDDATNDAARALQELHDNWRRSHATPQLATSAPKVGSKRSRPLSVDHGLQENVRGMLREQYTSVGSDDSYQVPLPTSSHDGRKRICCSAEAAQYSISSMHPAMGGLGGPGMWAGILN